MTLIEYNFANRRKSNRTVLNEFKITLNMKIKMHFDLNILSLKCFKQTKSGEIPSGSSSVQRILLK